MTELRRLVKAESTDSALHMTSQEVVAQVSTGMRLKNK